MSREEALSGREDVSRFIIHLTRNDQNDFSDGATARHNFVAILKSKKILSVRGHCLYNNQLKKLDESISKKFAVACFTEVPLNQLHLLVREIPGRNVKLQPYGFCFTKEFIVHAGGQPAIYINSYNGNAILRDCVDQIYNQSVTKTGVKSPMWRILPFINAMHEKYDFSWEREWRVAGTLKFKLRDLVCVVLPSVGEDRIKKFCAQVGLAAVSPGWTYEQIVTELAKQQRSTRALWEELK